MSNTFDLSHLPPPVQDAVLQLVEALVALPPARLEDQVTLLLARQAGQAPPRPALLGPSTAPCPHATRDTPCCAACAVVYTAEAVLADVQTAVQADGAHAFPRSAVELRILEALQQLYPMAVAPRQVAAMLGLPQVQARLMLQALTTLGTIDHPTMGYYRYRPTS